MTNAYAATDKQISYIEALVRDREADEETKNDIVNALRQGIDTKLASEFIGKLLKCPMKPRERNQLGAQHANGVQEDGMYKMPNGDIYKVQFNKAQGDGRRLYAKLLVVTQNADGTFSVHFEYAQGAVYKLTPDMRMTLEEAKEFGALYGTCCNCGRTLTNEESIELGIGPICRGKFAI